jgi:hypothetical protein
MTMNHDLAKQIEDLGRQHVDALRDGSGGGSACVCDGTAT